MDFVAIKNFGFVIQLEELKELIKQSKFKEEYKDDYCYVCDVASGLGFEYFSADNEFGLVFYGLEWREKIFEINCGGVFLLPFDRDSLFQRYEDYNDIYNEVLHNLTDNGFNINIDYVQKHCGLLEGVDICG